jgi:hypothetical protein
MKAMPKINLNCASSRQKVHPFNGKKEGQERIINIDFACGRATYYMKYVLDSRKE